MWQPSPVAFFIVITLLVILAVLYIISEIKLGEARKEHYNNLNNLYGEKHKKWK
jgi:hypothetical protein